LRSVMSKLMVAVVLLHAVLGCCLHHSHAGELGSAVPQVQTSPTGNPCHDRGRSYGPAGSHRHEGDPCHEERCVFVRPTQDDSEVKSACVGAVSIAHSISETTQLSQTRVWALRFVAHSHHLPVRSHLAKQVFLI
jgi:hypothetical protein